MSEFRLRTDRLVLREWQDADREPFAAINSDPIVMEFFFVSTLTRPKSHGLIDRFRTEFDRKGNCPRAVEDLDTRTFIGFVGLSAVPAVLSFH